MDIATIFFFIQDIMILELLTFRLSVFSVVLVNFIFLLLIEAELLLLEI